MILDDLLKTFGTVQKNFQPLRFITGIRYEANVLRFLNNITFLFDPNHTIGVMDETTMPISFIWIKKQTEILESEVSQKPLLFYNSQTINNPDAVAGGLLGIVSDNIIIKPKKYKLDVYVPATIERATRLYGMSSYQNMYANAFTTGVDISDDSGKITDDFSITWLSDIKNSTFALRNIISSLFKVLGVDYNFSGLSNLLLDQDDMNKASLEAMWKNRAIVKMKLWNGWKFKYVAIENVNLEKTGENDGFYEGTITVTELPIMTTAPERSVAKRTIKANSLLTSTMTKQINAITEEIEK